MLKPQKILLPSTGLLFFPSASDFFGLAAVGGNCQGRKAKPISSEMLQAIFPSEQWVTKQISPCWEDISIPTKFTLMFGNLAESGWVMNFILSEIWNDLKKWVWVPVLKHLKSFRHFSLVFFKFLEVTNRWGLYLHLRTRNVACCLHLSGNNSNRILIAIYLI